MIYIFIAVRISADDDLVGSGALNDTGILSQYTHTGVNGCFACGDAVGTPYQYIKAAGQGNIAALSAVSYISEKKKGE